MDANDGFVPIIAIFYAVFHPTEGTKIVHQVPEGSIASLANESMDLSDVLFNFDTVKNYIIPKPHLCNKLVLFKINGFRVLGFPVNIEGSKYSRNSFNFNFGFVFPYNSDTTPYESAIQRMGKMFRALEEQSFLLSKLDKDLMFFSKKPPVETNGIEYTPGQEKIKKFTLLSIESLIHQIYQDLNNYSECCIPIDTANSVDIKLFPILPPPVNLKAFQVPILTVKLNLLVDVNWDPTMVKILPYINGLNSVKKICELANADYLLTKQCIQHLMHYRCITMVDIFQFNNIYAPTNNIGNFLKMNGMAEECQAYIIATSGPDDLATPAISAPGTPATKDVILKRGIPGTKQKLGSPSDVKSMSVSASPFTRPGSSVGGKSLVTQQTIQVPSKATLFYLYRLLNQGQTIKEWYIQHQKALKSIDIRRFINFGVVRGIIYRVNLFPVLHSVTKSIENGSGNKDDLDEVLHAYEERIKEAHQRTFSGTKDHKEVGLLKNSANESNLKTGKKKRTVSFNYHVDRYSRSEEEEEYFEDLDVFDSDSDTSVHNDTTNSDHESSESEEDSNEKEDIVKLIKLIKGIQHMDSICTELQKPRCEIERLLDKLGQHSVINS